MNPETQAKTPQYQRLAAQLRGHIRAGALKPGDRLPSWAQMQREYGVNKYTIERAQKVLADEGLLVCRQGSGTFVAELKKPASRKGIIGLCGAGFSFPMAVEPSAYWTQLSYGIREAAQRAGQHVLLLDHHSTEGWEKADGMLFSAQASDTLVSNIPHGLPCVSLLMEVPGMCSVYSDDGDGIRQAVDHLVGLGHRKIGCYFHGIAGPGIFQRTDAYRAALATAGIALKVEWMREMRGLPRYKYRFDYGQRFVETGRENMRQWLREGWTKLGCTALLAHNDEFAFGIIEALQEAGLRVPEDISVFGFDGAESSASAQPALSTVQVPLEDIGRKGVEILLQQIEADVVSRENCILPVSLQLGATTAPPISI